jgi:hypothetical protein
MRTTRRGPSPEGEPRCRRSPARQQGSTRWCRCRPSPRASRDLRACRPPFTPGKDIRVAAPPLNSPAATVDLPGRVDHLVLLRNDGGQHLLLLSLLYLEVVERAGDLGSDLVELLRRDVEVLMGLVQLLAGVAERSPAASQSQSVRMNFRPGSWPVSFHPFKAGFTLSFGFLTIWSLNRSTTMAIALTPPIRSYRLCSAIAPPCRVPARPPQGHGGTRSLRSTDGHTGWFDLSEGVTVRGRWVSRCPPTRDAPRRARRRRRSEAARLRPRGRK